MNDSSQKEISIIIPAYNEEKRISKVLDEISNYIHSNNLNWEIIVSIDGNDKTDEIVKEFSQKYNFIRYDKKSGRNGKGNSIKRVLPKVNGKFIIMMDADNSIHFDEIKKSFHLMEKYDVILFNRYSNDDNYIPLVRKIASRGFNMLVQAFLRLNIKDTKCGYKIIRSDLMKKAFEQITITNGSFDIALLYYLKKMNASIIEINVKYSHDIQSKFNVVGDALANGITLFGFMIRHSRFYKYVPEWARDLYYRKFRWI
jgi:glycosyltransferase involved in cell wall biosynthesis